jgi:hypothetical protein
MHLPRSTYYDAPPVKADDAEIVAAITAICNEFEAYGYRRVGAELRHQGIAVNSKKVRRLMREHDLQPKRRRGFVATTDSDHDGPIVPDLARDSGRKVRDVMTRNVWTVTLDASLAEVVHLMERHNIKRIPVVEANKIVGTVTRANLLHAMASFVHEVPASPLSLLAAVQLEPGALPKAAVRRGAEPGWGQRRNFGILDLFQSALHAACAIDRLRQDYQIST